MALNASRLSKAILDAATGSGKMKDGDDGTLKAMCDAIAGAVVSEIKQATITVPAALLASTPAAPGSPVASPVAPTPIPPGNIA